MDTGIELMPNWRTTHLRKAAAAILAGWMLILAAPSMCRAERPALVVVVSIDQFPYSYLERFRKNFAADGLFSRMQSEGLVYSNCHHAHAFTFTGPGHASLLTGTYPARHGIINNTWYDRTAKKDVYCCYDKDSPVIGDPKADGISPRNLLAPTVGDVLKLESAGKSKVFGISLKDRAAVLMSGRAADAAFWFQNGLFVTSRYYRADVPGYLRVLNESGLAKGYGGKQWTLLYPKDRYTEHHPDDSPVERPPEKFGKTFPHTLAQADDKNYAAQLNVTPFANELTLIAAERILSFEKLGMDDDPDLLDVGLSANDLCGHAFGPYSLEVEDMTYRTDVMLGAFVRAVEKHMAGRPWVLALTSDHGIAPNPLFAADRRLAAKADPLGKLTELQGRIDAALARRFPLPFGEKSYVQKLESNQLYLRRDQPALVGENMVIAEKIARDVMLEQSSVVMAITREDLLAGGAKMPLQEALTRAFNPRRSGDLLFVTAPYHVHVDKTGTTHGSPWRYDTNVPLAFLGSPGAGIQHAKIERRVNTPALAATVSRLFGIQPPPAAEEEALPEVFNRKPNE
jgi:predicted AlkP superfamily pyrophosphatase or phosphodiesterase